MSVINLFQIDVILVKARRSKWRYSTQNNSILCYNFCLVQTIYLYFAQAICDVAKRQWLTGACIDVAPVSLIKLESTLCFYTHTMNNVSAQLSEKRNCFCSKWLSHNTVVFIFILCLADYSVYVQVCLHSDQRAPVIKHQLYMLTVSATCPSITICPRPIIKEMRRNRAQWGPALLWGHFFGHKITRSLWMTQQTHIKVLHWPFHLSHQFSLQLFYYKSGFKPAQPITPSPFSLSGRFEYPH